MPRAVFALVGRLLLGLACVLVFGPGAAGAAQPAPKQVVFIRYPIAPNHFQTVVDNFKRTMAQQGYREGREVNYVDVLTSTADEASVPEVIAAVNRYKDTADMFVTCGWVSMSARQILKNTKVPQLFVPVLDAVALKMLPSLKSPPDTNLSGLYLMYPPEKILRIAKFVIPDLCTYAYVYDSRIPADRIFEKAYESLSPEQRHGIDVRSIDLAQGEAQAVHTLETCGAEAYGGIVGAFQHRKALNRSGLPEITAFTLDIDENSIAAYLDDDDNTVAGLFNPFGYCGAQAALMTADIFDGKATIDKTVPRPAMQVAFVNLKASRRLNLHISFKVLEAVDLVVK